MKPMTKLALAAAIATTVSTGANAVAITSNITDFQFVIGSIDILDPAGANWMEIGGDTVAGVTLTGELTLYTAGTHVYLDWQLTDGVRQGLNGAGGTMFNGGYIYLSTSTDGGATVTPFDTVDVSVTNMPFLAGSYGHIAGPPTQTTAGLVIDDSGNGVLAGLWDLQFFGVGFNSAVATTILVGSSSALFLEGTVSPVPVPAAAWLFGSALLSMVGMARRRKTA